MWVIGLDGRATYPDGHGVFRSHEVRIRADDGQVLSSAGW